MYPPSTAIYSISLIFYSSVYNRNCFAFLFSIVTILHPFSPCNRIILTRSQCTVSTSPAVSTSKQDGAQWSIDTFTIKISARFRKVKLGGRIDLGWLKDFDGFFLTIQVPIRLNRKETTPMKLLL